MERRVWPVEIPANNNFTAIEREIYMRIKRTKINCWFLVDIDPVGLCNEKVRMGIIIHPEKGVVSFSAHSDITSEVMSLSADMYISMVEDKVYNLLIESAMLIKVQDSKKVFKYPYKHVAILEETNNISNSRCYTADCFASTADIENLFDEDFSKPYGAEIVNIAEEEAVAILSKLAPEYTVVKPQKLNVEVSSIDNDIINVEELPSITGKEIEYASFLLDEEQVKYINEMGTGHRVLLANAGAGKSVLLLSRAYRYASAHKKSRVLITCYNNNLGDAYKFKNSCASSESHNNLFIMTQTVDKVALESISKSHFSAFRSSFCCFTKNNIQKLIFQFSFMKHYC